MLGLDQVFKSGKTSHTEQALQGVSPSHILSFSDPKQIIHKLLQIFQSSNPNPLMVGMTGLQSPDFQVSGL